MHDPRAQEMRDAWAIAIHERLRGDAKDTEAIDETYLWHVGFSLGCGSGEWAENDNEAEPRA